MSNKLAPQNPTTHALPRFSGDEHLLNEAPITVDDSGNVNVPDGATVDGRDISVDGTKLDTIETGAQATTFTNVQTALAAATGTVDFNGQQVTCSAAPSGSTSLCNKAYVDALASGHVITNGADARATSDLTLSGVAQTADGVALTAGKRVLADGQTNHVQKGLWVVASGAWTRPTDFATGSHANGASVFVSGGTLYANTGWACNTSNPSDVVDTDPLTFTQTSAPGSFLAGTGLTLTGNTFSVTTPVTEANVRTVLAAATADITVNDKKISTAAVPTAGPDLVNKTYADALVAGFTGIQRVIRFAIGTTTVSSATSLPAGAYVLDARLEVTTQYSNGTTITIGQTGGVSIFQSTTDNAPQTVGVYVVEQDTAASADTILVTITPGTVAGAGVVLVKYVVPSA